MAKARSNLSVWVTVVMAVATVLVVSGILIAPQIAACQASGESLGGCVRDRLMSLLGSDEQSVAAPAVASSEPSVSSSLPGIDASTADVAELETPAATLNATGGTVDLSSVLQPVAPTTEAALSNPPGELELSSAATASSSAASAVDLTAYTGDLTTSVVPPSTPAPPIASLSSQAGVLTATIETEPAPSVAALAEPKLVPRGDTGWTTAWRRSIPEPAPKRVAEKPPVAAIPAPRKPAATPLTPPQPTVARPRRVPKADPRYPNVLVLPTPKGPSDSSFSTLTLR